MNPGEKIYISSVDCSSIEDSFENGEVGGVCLSWTDDELRMDKTVGYKTVSEALAAVCQANRFDYSKGAWENFKDGDDVSRFDTDIIVDSENSQASASQLERWRAGKCTLYCCHVIVKLEVRAIRGLSEEEADEAL